MNFRDVELLSAYLDGQLNPSDSARIESRLSSDPDLRSVYEDLASARSLLRKLPARKAPRNFTLTPKMVGLKPPLPRAFPTFRFAAVLASLLFFLTYATNYVSATMTAAPVAYGMGGGGGCDNCTGEQPPAQAAAPAATQAPAATVPSTESAQLQAQAAPTETAVAPADQSRSATAPAPEPFMKNNLPVQPQPAPLISQSWQIGLLLVALACGAIAYAMRLAAIRKWRNLK